MARRTPKVSSNLPTLQSRCRKKAFPTLTSSSSSVMRALIEGDDSAAVVHSSVSLRAELARVNERTLVASRRRESGDRLVSNTLHPFSSRASSTLTDMLSGTYRALLGSATSALRSSSPYTLLTRSMSSVFSTTIFFTSASTSSSSITLSIALTFILANFSLASPVRLKHRFPGRINAPKDDDDDDDDEFELNFEF